METQYIFTPELKKKLDRGIVNTVYDICIKESKVKDNILYITLDLLKSTIVLDPYAKVINLRKDCSYRLVEDLYYCNKEEWESDTIPSFFVIKRTNKLYIPKDTIMVYKGDNVSGWPCFSIEGEELDFAGDPFVLEIV